MVACQRALKAFKCIKFYVSKTRKFPNTTTIVIKEAFLDLLTRVKIAFFSSVTSVLRHFKQMHQWLHLTCFDGLILMKWFGHWSRSFVRKLKTIEKKINFKLLLTVCTYVYKISMENCIWSEFLVFPVLLFEHSRHSQFCLSRFQNSHFKFLFMPRKVFT